MAKKNPFEAFEGMYSALSRFESILSRFNTENYFRLVDNLTKVRGQGEDRGRFSV